MSEILTWPPVLWTARVLLTILLGGASYVVALYFVRFLRPKHVKRLLTADLPTIHALGGSAEVLGQKLELNATLDHQRDAEIRALEQGLQAAVGMIEQLSSANEALTNAVQRLEEAHVQRIAAGQGPGETGSGEPG